MPDTCAGVSRLSLSMPSVSTTTARCEPPRAATRRAVSAIASCSEVMPNGSDLPERRPQRIAFARERPAPRAARLSKLNSRDFVRAPLQPRQQLIRRAPAAFVLRATSMLPLVSKSNAT